MIETKEYIRCMIDTEKYFSKPDYIGSIVNRLGDEEQINNIYIEDLAKKIMEGYSVKPAISGTKETEWQQQQLFFIDVDDGLNIQQAINRSRKLNIVPAFIYTSFSHTAEHNKFRMVFVADKIITDFNKAKTIQITLTNLFGADQICKNLNRVYYAGQSIVYENYDVKIDTDYILNNWMAEVEEVKGVQNKYNIVYPKNQNQDTNFNIQAIKDLNVQYMKSVVNNIEGVFVGLIKEYNNTFFYQSDETQKYIATTRMEVYDLINKIDLADFLGIHNPKKFKCIIHDDNNPSAGIFKGDDGSDIYKCQSSSCGFVGGIIKIVEKLAGCNKPTAINFIKDIYGIELLQSDWQKEQINLLEINKEYLMSGKMEFEYPQLWKYVKPRVGKLICLIDLAVKNCYGEELSYNRDC